jgi:hypothetical protein
MCKETLVIPVKRLVYQKRIIGKNGRPKDEERPPPQKKCISKLKHMRAVLPFCLLFTKLN